MGGCNAGYPVLGDIPWLFADPQSMRAQWRGRLQFLVLSIEREVRTLRTELAGDLKRIGATAVGVARRGL